MTIKRFHGECLRKKKLREEWANGIIRRAGKEGTSLRKYWCPHCLYWHVTRMNEKDFIKPK